MALVTGANQRIGAAIARAFAAQGAAVFLTYLRLGLNDAGIQATGLMTYAAARHQTADAIVDEIRVAGRRAAPWELGRYGVTANLIYPRGHRH